MESSTSSTRQFEGSAFSYSGAYQEPITGQPVSSFATRNIEDQPYENPKTFQEKYAYYELPIEDQSQIGRGPMPPEDVNRCQHCCCCCVTECLIEFSTTICVEALFSCCD